MSASRSTISLIAAVCLTASSLLGSAPLPPEPPRPWNLEAPGASSGTVIAVPAGADLQAALDKARPGDQITLEPGATYTGPFTLPKKSGDAWIVLRSRDGDARMPPPGTRIDPSFAAAMPRLVSSSSHVILAAPGAHHYRLVGLQINPTPGSRLVNLVQLGAEETAFENFPHHIILERCYLHGDPRQGTRRGVAMNSRFTAVIDSYFSDFKEDGGDSQAIAGWAGPGPYTILNNHLEAAGENIMFGGGDPAIEGLVPSDIQIRRNRLTKPLSWRDGSSGASWTVKNLLELKNARRVLIEGNLLEHNWAQAQSGFAVLFTVRNQDGTAPWSVVSDVRFTNNLVRHAGGGINFLGRDDSQSNRSAQTARLAIQNSLFEDIGPARWGGSGILFQILNGTSDITIEHVTAIQTGAIVFAEGPAHTGFAYRHNISLHNEHGVSGTGTGAGIATLRTYFPSAVFEKNLIVGGEQGKYPPGNFFPATPVSVRFVDFPGGCYRLHPSSKYRGGGIAGGDPGADLRALCSAMAPTDRPGPLCGAACLGGTR